MLLLLLPAVLLLLNTYPLLVSQNLVFRTKQTAMVGSVKIAEAALSGLADLTEDNVAQAMSAVEETGVSRVLVTDTAGRILYDTREGDNARGLYAFYTEIAQALRGNDTFYCRYDGEAFLSRGASPVVYHNQIVGAVYAYEYDTVQAELLRSFQTNIMRISLLVALFVLFLSALLSRMFTRRISDLLQAIRQVREGAYSHRAKVTGSDEIAQLAAEFNSLTDRLQRTESARRQFVSDASHELRTPIAVIQGYAALLDRWGKDDPEALQESISAIRSEAKSMEELVEQLLFLARGDNDTQPVKPSLFDLSALAGEVLREEEMICPDRVFLPRWGEEPVPVRADQGLIKQVMRILMDNAIKYSPPGSRIYLRLSTQERYARLTVQDEGDGIPPESIPHIFERFYRTDQSRDRKTGGTGLGLSIARWIVERHEGWFEVVSRPGVGTRISFLLPLAPPEQEAG